MILGFVAAGIHVWNPLLLEEGYGGIYRQNRNGVSYAVFGAAVIGCVESLRLRKGR